MMFQRQRRKKAQQARGSRANGLFFPPPGYPLSGCSSAEPDSVSPSNVKFNARQDEMRTESLVVKNQPSKSSGRARHSRLKERRGVAAGRETCPTKASVSISTEPAGVLRQAENRQNCTPALAFKNDISAPRVSSQIRHNCTPGPAAEAPPNNPYEPNQCSADLIRSCVQVMKELAPWPNVDFEVQRHSRRLERRIFGDKMMVESLLTESKGEWKRSVAAYYVAPIGPAL